MTCIVGLIHEKRVYMGGDSAISLDDGFKDTIQYGKLFRSGDLIIGSSGTLRASQLVRYEVTFKKRPLTYSSQEYMVKVVAAEIRKCIQAKDATNNKEFNGTILIGYQGELFEMSSDFSIVQSTAEYAAIGSGGELALGALFATADPKRGYTPEERIILALEAAARFNAGVCPPYFMEIL